MIHPRLAISHDRDGRTQLGWVRDSDEGVGYAGERSHSVSIWLRQLLSFSPSYFSNSGGDAFFFPLPHRGEEIQCLEHNHAHRYRCYINYPAQQPARFLSLLRSGDGSIARSTSGADCWLYPCLRTDSITASTTVVPWVPAVILSISFCRQFGAKKDEVSRSDGSRIVWKRWYVYGELKRYGH